MKRICFIGASTTEGLGDRSRRGWVGNLHCVAEQQIVCFNLGVRGQTIFQISKRAASECRARMTIAEQGAIVLGCTLNELARLEDGSKRNQKFEIMDCYSRLISDLSDIAAVFVVGPPPVLQSRMPFFSLASGLSLDFRNSDIDKHDKAMCKLCAEMDVPYISVFDNLSENKTYQTGLAFNDGLHTDAHGYVAMAEVIEEFTDWKKLAPP